MNKDSIYWAFSAAAQAISTFIAFLIASYSFVYFVMDNKIEKDETLREIYDELKNEYFTTIKKISIYTGIDIVASLLLVYFNDYNYQLKPYFIIMVFILIIITIWGSIKFVIEIIDPDRYRNVADNLIREEEYSEKILSQKEKEKTIDASEYLKKFRDVELLIRDMVEQISKKNYYRKEYIPLSKIINLMREYKIIDSETYGTLHKLIKMRNLTTHSKIDKIYYEYMNLLIKAEEKLSEIKKELIKTKEEININ